MKKFILSSICILFITTQIFGQMYISVNKKIRYTYLKNSKEWIESEEIPNYQGSFQLNKDFTKILHFEEQDKTDSTIQIIKYECNITDKKKSTEAAKRNLLQYRFNLNCDRTEYFFLLYPAKKQIQLINDSANRMTMFTINDVKFNE